MVDLFRRHLSILTYKNGNILVSCSTIQGEPCPQAIRRMSWGESPYLCNYRMNHFYCFFVLDLQHITCFYSFHRWLDPQKLVRKQVRRNSSHNSSSSNAKEPSGSTHHQNGHAQKTSTGSGSSTNNVIILYFRVKFYVTGNHVDTIIIHNDYYNTVFLQNV